MGLFLRKTIQAVTEAKHDGPNLKRHLNAFHLTSIGIGAIIGAGIFLITGQAAAQFAGPSIVISFLIAALICILAGLCYAELSALIPSSGGSYAYAYVALGEFPAWIVGWTITAQCLFSASTVAVGWSSYFVSLCKDFGLLFPSFLTQAPFIYSPVTGWEASGSLINLPAILLIAVIGFLISVGTRTAANFTNVMVFIKLGAVLLFILMGLGHIHPENWIPFIPENQGVFGSFGWSGILRGSGLVFFAYMGFDTVSTLAQDTINPQRNLPRGILASLGICTIAYVVMALVLTGVVSYTLLNVPDPMAVALHALGPQFFWLSTVIEVAILAAFAGVVLVQLLGQTRIFYAMGQDGLIPKSLSSIHPKTSTPIIGSVVSALISAVVAGLFSVEVLGQLTVIATLFLYALVCLGVWILRKTHAHEPRPFKVPFVPWIPLAGMAACLGQMAFFPLSTWVQLAAWLVVGVVLYFVYGRHHSRLRGSP